MRHLSQTVFDYPWHFHPEVELNLIQSGRGMRIVGDSVEAFEPGEVTLISGGTPHAFLSPSGQDRTDAAVCVQFSPGAFGSDFLDLAATQAIVGLLERGAHGLVFEGATREAVSGALIRLAEKNLSGLRKLAVLLEILATLAESRDYRVLSVGAGQGAASVRQASRVGKVMEYLGDLSSRQPSQREAARLLAMSPGTFSRFFTRHFGTPFVTYVAELRIGNACRLLLDDDVPITEIAGRVGFNNIANFNRHFRRVKGTTPSAYRKLVCGARSAAVLRA